MLPSDLARFAVGVWPVSSYFRSVLALELLPSSSARSLACAPVPASVPPLVPALGLPLDLLLGSPLVLALASLLLPCLVTALELPSVSA